MAMEEALVARLRAAAGVGLAGATVDWFDRPDIASGPVPLAVTLTAVAPGREWTHGGPDGLDRPTVQFDAWGPTKAAVMALARAVQAEMEQARDVGGVRFTVGWLELRQTMREDDLPGGRSVFRVQQDYSFYHEEV